MRQLNGQTIFQTICECVMRLGNKCVWAYGLIPKDSNPKAMQTIYKSNQDALMQVSLDWFAYVFAVFISFFIIFAGLVIDGSIAYPFNDGAKVLLQVHPEDALLTVTLRIR